MTKPWSFTKMNRAKWLFPFCLIVILSLSCQLLTGHAVLESDLLPYLPRFTETDPPVGPVRPVAEFEPASHVLIRYPLGIPVSLVAQLSNTANVICIVSSTTVQNTATNAFNNGGVNMANVSFLIAASDSYWTRDYGPWFIFDGNDNYGVVDFRYNRPRPNDNLIPEVFANQNGLTYYGMNLYQTGGNYMTDGINTAAQTTIAYSENSSLTQAQVNARMLAYMGIVNYHVLPDPNNTYIDHIDCWGKFLAPDKVLIRSVPSTHSQYTAIEQTAAYFASQNCAWGYPYKVYRVYTPQNQPYTNSLILNRKVFVPIMNSTHDAAALQSYRDAMPGYEVIGVAGTTSAPWESTDALHCRAHEIPDQVMLHISHLPHWGILPYAASLEFNAVIKAHSGQPVIADSVYVRYRKNQEAWQTLPLSYLSGADYSASLTNFTHGDTIRYFIHAADASGRSLSHPYFAELDPHIFVIMPDLEPPTIIHGNVPPSIQSGEHSFSAVVTDNVLVDRVVFRYRIDDNEPVEMDMATDPEASPDYWYVSVLLDFVSGQQNFYYQIEAWDAANPPNSACYPWPGEWISVPITGVATSDDLLPASDTGILSLYPNPFRNTQNGNLYILYNAKANAPVELKVFNSRGQLVHQASGRSESAGNNKFVWKGVDDRQQNVASGIYLVQLTIDGKVFSGKVLITK